MSYERTDRTRLRRLPDRGSYDRELVHSILDEALICHAGFAVEGRPFVIPTIHARIGDTLYVHGSAASRMLRTLREGVEACVTVTLVDGLVLARSAFHHSMNYRSVMVFGVAREVTSDEERGAALDAIVEHVAKGRLADVRPPNERELRQTMVLSLPIEEVSAKVRSGPAGDDEEDYALPIWAGVLPLRLVAGAPEPDTRLVPGVELPEYLRGYARGARTED